MVKILYKITDTEGRYLIGSTKSSLYIKFKNLKTGYILKPNPLSPLADPKCKIELVRELADDADMKMAERYEIIRCHGESGTEVCLNRTNPIFRSDQDFSEVAVDRMDNALNIQSRYVLRNYYANREKVLRSQMLRRIRFTGISCLKLGTLLKYNITQQDIDKELLGYRQNN